jgi:hypothetical protein
VAAFFGFDSIDQSGRDGAAGAFTRCGRSSAASGQRQRACCSSVGDSGTVTAVGRANCAVPGYADCSDLAASTYPTEIVEAERWLKQHPNLQGDQLAKAVNQQPWDASVKGLTAFPSVIENMNTNLSLDF